MKAVILAGGKGTRLGQLAKETPKSMLLIGNTPLLEHQISLLNSCGIKDIIILTNHLSEVIGGYFRDGSGFGVNITYFREKTPLGTTGGLKEIRDILVEDFLLLYGDVMVDMDLNGLIEFHKRKKGMCTLVLHPNDHPYDSDLVEIDKEQRIIAFHSKPHDSSRNYGNLVSAALYVMSPRVLDYIETGVKADFGKDIFPKLVDKERLCGYITAEYLKDVGTPERIEKVNRDYSNGRIERFNKKHKRRAIFIDRDGVINENIPNLHKVEDFKLLPDVGKAIKKINDSDFLVILITNQPVIAKNLCSIKELEGIHKKMETLLGKENAKLDAIYYCPHHPDKGYPGENPDYKIDCDCRKPKIGMLKRAERDFNIDLSTSFFIGDSFKDILCGKNAGMTAIGVRTGEACKGADIDPDYMFKDLYEATSFIIREPYKDYSEKVKNIFAASKKRPFVVSIGGNARSGKSTFSKYLAEEFRRMGKKVLVVGLDNWILSENKRKKEHDVYDRFHINNIYKSVSDLLNGREVILDKYDSLTRQQTDKKISFRLNGEDAILIEGVVALSSEELRKLAHLKIFCEVPRDLVKERVYDFYAWKGLEKRQIEELFMSRKVDEYDLIPKDKVHADIVISSRGN